MHGLFLSLPSIFSITPIFRLKYLFLDLSSYFYRARHDLGGAGRARTYDDRIMSPGL